MKQCRYCNQDIVYSSTNTRGAWYAKGGRICPTATEEFGMAVQHMPEWDLKNRTWK